MIYENVELTGSLNITGSLIVPFGGDEHRVNQTGSLFFNTASSQYEIYTGESGSEWQDIFAGTGSGGSGGEEGADAFTASPLNYLIVAGGGGGGSRYYGGGGGGGGFLSSSIASTNSSIASGSTFTITVGAGGAASPSSGDGGNGGNSSIAATGLTTITSTGGGGGGGSTSGGSGNADGNDGGSGGGARAWSGTHQHGYGTTGQGHRAGVSNTGHTDYVPAFDSTQYSNAGSNAWGSGGGGAGEVGHNSHYMLTNNPNPGQGGDGSGSMITGTNTTYAGGGGGGWNANNGTGTQGITPYQSDNGRAPGGAGGGGRGGKGFTTPYSVAEAGTTNTGGGGGAGSHSGANNGASGGSGIVIVSYDSGSMGGAGGIKGDDGNGNRYHVFNSTDTFVLGNTDDFDIDTDSLGLFWNAGDFASRGTSTWTDLSGNSRNGTVSGATLGGNYYYTFDGSNDSIRSSYHKPAGAQSIVFWMRFAGNGSNGYSLSGWQESGTGVYLYVGRQNTGSRPYFYAGNSGGAVTDQTIANNTWVMLTVTIDASLNYAVYQNTTSITTGTTTSNVANTTDFRAGSVNDTSNHHHNGDIGIAAHYTKALTSTEVTAFYNATKQNFV